MIGRIFSLFTIVALMAGSLSAQESYDYVLPDSSTKEKKTGVSLPIKPREAQPVYFVPSYMDDNEVQDLTEAEDEFNKKKEGRTSVNLEVGASVASGFNGGTAVSTYAAPHVRHQIDDRLAVSGGVVLSQTYFDGWTNYSIDGRPYSMPSSVTTKMAYGRLDYRINERLLVYGAVYTNLTTIPQPGFNQNLQGTGYTLGMEYKMSDRSFLQVQIHRSTGYNPFVPYNNFGFGSRPISYFP